MTISYLQLRLEIRAELKFMVKLQRADGGCLGARERRKTWIAAISLGEPLNRLRSGDL